MSEAAPPIHAVRPGAVAPLAPYLLTMLGGLAGVALIFHLSPVAAGLLYATLFLTVAWAQPSVGLMLIIAAAPLPYNLAVGLPVRFSLAEINLSLMALVLAGKVASNRVSLRMGPAIVPVLAYLGVCVVSTAFGWRGFDALKSMLQMVLYLVVGVAVFASFVRRRSDIVPVMYALVAVGVFLALAVATSSTGYALGIHKNSIGGSLNCVVLVCIEIWFAQTRRRRRTLWMGVLIVCTAGLFFTVSRGAWLGTVTGTMVILAMRGRMGLAWRLAVVVVPILVIGWFTLSHQMQSYVIGVGDQRANIEARYESVDLAWRHFERGPLWGVGVGLREEADATNIVLFTLAETGIAGLVTLTWLHWRSLRRMWWAKRRLDPSDPLFMAVVLGAALLVAVLTHGVVDHYWSRGALTVAWCMFGAGGGVYARLKEDQQEQPPLPNQAPAEDQA